MRKVAAIIIVLLSVLAAGFTTSYATTKAAATCVPHTGQHCKTTSTATSTTGTTTTTTGGDINQNSTWNCTTAQNGTNVVVDILQPDSGDAVLLRAGCTGYINSIIVRQYHGDGIKVDGAKNLEVGSINVKCYAHDVGKHQDGAQVLGGGLNVKFDGGYIGCYSANNSCVWMNPATSNGTGAVNVVFWNLTCDPKGSDFLESGAPPNFYGPGGAYGMANVTSTDSGFEDSTLLSNPNHHPCLTGSGAVGPIWTGTTFPAGDNCP